MKSTSILPGFVFMCFYYCTVDFNIVEKLTCDTGMNYLLFLNCDHHGDNLLKICSMKLEEAPVKFM